MRNIYTPEMKKYIKKNYQKVTYGELSVMINARFKTDFTKEAIQHFAYNYGLRKGNKNGFYPVGYERVNNKGYIMIKVSMYRPGTIWKEKHRWVWEQANGKIPKKHVIVFLDGNRFNCTLENLAMLSRTEVVKMNQFGFFFNDRNLTLDGIAIVKHSMAIHNQLRKKLGSREHKKFNNSASRKRIKERFSKKWGEKAL